MKFRYGFVSNSSSCSFIVPKKILSEGQMDKLRNHIEYARNNFPQISYANDEDTWSIEETDEQMTLSTCMNNFDMEAFLIAIGVPEENIEWSPY